MSNILVTGANRGIGLELCRQLAARGDQVIAVCRNSSAGLAALNLRTFSSVDVTDPGSLKDLSEQLADEQLDCLLNNAGILIRDSLQDLSPEAVVDQFRVNALGPLNVTRALLGNLGQGSRVAIITSRMGSIEDNTSGGYYGYRMSKAAVNMAGMSLARDLHSRGIAVALLHPGMVATEMTGNNGVPVADSARGLIERIDSMDLDDSGSFWHAEGYKLPW